MTGYIEAVCTSRKKGTVKKEKDQAVLCLDLGIEGDAHAGNGHRQISILQGESIDKMREKVPALSNGAFGENIVTRNLDLSQLDIGDQLTLGNEVVIEITQIGKECHTACVIRTLVGDCIMPIEGIFSKVIKGGCLYPGNDIRIVN
tara:strand:+ start:2568 stop:3005 length:438 start_codon:yes stop_codon:yes gene_type:complete